MSDEFRDDDSSAELGQRREFYDIVQSDLVTYRIASGARDIVYGGNTYTSQPAARTDVVVSTTTGVFEMSLSLPLKHPLVQRYLAFGSPPRQITVTVWQMQLNSGAVERIWLGVVTSMAIEHHVAKFLIPSPIGSALQRMVPSMMIDRLCPHILYDAQCRIDPTAFSVESTVVRFDGRQITLVTQLPFGDEQFALFGDVTHVATGERQTIFTEDPLAVDGTTTFQMQDPIRELAVGDAMLVRAGCLHDITTCHNKFDNLVNYGGAPEKPTANPFSPTGIGFVIPT